jgi:hypothetical protein
VSSLSSAYLLLLLDPAFIFDPEDGGDMFRRNAVLSAKHTALRPRRPYSSIGKTQAASSVSHAWRTRLEIGLDREPEIINRGKEASKRTWHILLQRELS